MKGVAACLALLLTIQCAAGYSGFIRTSGEKFVDDNCDEFVPLGMNTYVTYLPSADVCTAPCELSRTCRLFLSAQASPAAHALFSCARI